MCLLTAYKSTSVLKAMIAKEKSIMKKTKTKKKKTCVSCIRVLQNFGLLINARAHMQASRNEAKREATRRDVASQYFVHTNTSTIDECNPSLSTHIYLL